MDLPYSHHNMNLSALSRPAQEFYRIPTRRNEPNPPLNIKKTINVFEQPGQSNFPKPNGDAGLWTKLTPVKHGNVFERLGPANLLNLTCNTKSVATSTPKNTFNVFEQPGQLSFLIKSNSNTNLMNPLTPIKVGTIFGRLGPAVSSNTNCITPLTAKKPSSAFVRVEPTSPTYKKPMGVSGRLLPLVSPNSNSRTVLGPLKLPLRRPKSQFFVTGEFYNDLMEFIREYRLPTAVLTIRMKMSANGRSLLYDYLIKIGEDSFTNYPSDCTDIESAQATAAKAALIHLIPKYANRKLLVTSSDEQLISKRIWSLVAGHSNGMTSWKLEAVYVEQYNEQLPGNWLEIVKNMPHVPVEDVAGNKLAVRDVSAKNNEMVGGTKQACR